MNEWNILFEWHITKCWAWLDLWVTRLITIEKQDNNYKLIKDWSVYILHLLNTRINSIKNILKFVEEGTIMELTQWDIQSKKQDLRSCRAGHSITKWKSVSKEFNGHNLQVRRWYGVFGFRYHPVSTCSGRQPPRTTAKTQWCPLQKILHRFRLLFITL